MSLYWNNPDVIANRINRERFGRDYNTPTYRVVDQRPTPTIVVNVPSSVNQEANDTLNNQINDLMKQVQEQQRQIHELKQELDKERTNNHIFNKQLNVEDQKADVVTQELSDNVAQQNYILEEVKNSIKSLCDALSSLLNDA